MGVVITLGALCFWVLCGLAAHSLLRNHGAQLTARDMILIIMQGPVGLIALLLRE
jgi:hypothetical protein